MHVCDDDVQCVHACVVDDDDDDDYECVRICAMMMFSVRMCAMTMMLTMMMIMNVCMCAR